MSDTTAQRSRLLGVKLAALVREHIGGEVGAEPVEFQPGAALYENNAAWVLLDDDAGDRLGASLAWALRAEADALHVIAGDSYAGQVARRAAGFEYPVSVWRADGRQLLTVTALQPAPSVSLSEEHGAFRDLIVEGGADPVVEHGVLAGEVRGLEVCRVVDGADRVARLEVGIGAHDREAFQLMHGEPDAVQLRRVVDQVAADRTVDGPHHPLRRLAAERLLRWRAVDDPSLVGAVTLAVAEPPVRRLNLKDAVPCVAHGVDRDGRLVVAVFASGVDLELVPFAVDALAAAVSRNDVASASHPRLVVATPARDQIAVIVEMARRLRVEAELVAV